MTTIEQRLPGKVAIITGAASGIGRAMTLLFARHGASVVAVDLDDAGLEQLRHLAESAGSPISTCHADVSSEEASEGAVERVLAEHDQLDILCNNAGIIRRASVVEIMPEDWDRDIAVNLKSVYLWSRAVLPHMIARGAGVILNTGSGWGLVGGVRAASYCAAKGAVVQLTRAMAMDHGPQGVRVNCICPGDTDTPMLRNEAQQVGGSTDEFLADAASRPMGRVGAPEDIALAALYLVSDDAAFVTGTTLVVDGGGLAGS